MNKHRTAGESDAPGHPGATPRWSSGAKTGVGTAVSPESRIAAGKRLRIDVLAPAKVHWSADDWTTNKEIMTTELSLGVHWALLDLAQVRPGEKVLFTFFWLDSHRWDGSNVEVT